MLDGGIGPKTTPPEVEEQAGSEAVEGCSWMTVRRHRAAQRPGWAEAKGVRLLAEGALEKSLGPTLRRTWMTPAMSETLEMIKRWNRVRGHPPTIREMMAALNVTSTGDMHRRITALVERGYLRRLPNRARALEVVADPHLPTDISQLSIDVLAAEIRRRGMVVGQVVETIYHEQGSAPVVKRKFKILEETNGKSTT